MVASRRRRSAVAILAWLLITICATALHWWVWILAPGADGSSSTIESWPKILSGFLQMVSLPGWALVSKAFRTAASGNVWFAGASYAIGFAIPLLAAIVVAGARRWWLSRAVRPLATIDLSRRRLLTDGPLALMGMGGSSAFGISTIIEPWRLVRRAHTVPIRGLPLALDGLRIVQLSDTHLGPRVPAWHIERAVEMALAPRPQLVLLTGDYIHDGARYIKHAAALFRPLVGTGLPCVGVLGNHDWSGGGAAMRDALANVGVRMIDNARIFFGPGGRLDASPFLGAICLAGVGDLIQDVVDLDAALGGVDPQMPRVLLSHNPDVAEMIGPNRRVDLMLAGHTHGGQVTLPFIGPPIVPSGFGAKYAGGLVAGPACPVIISAGIGVSIIPVRMGVPPEVVEVTLTRA